MKTRKNYGVNFYEIAPAILVVILSAAIVLLLFARIEFSERSVSGIVYNKSSNSFISGNTNFSIRASENTYITEENQSSFCLPPNSPYEALVSEASRNKDIKLIVTNEKVFTLVSTPWTCVDNVKVERVNNDN